MAAVRIDWTHDVTGITHWEVQRTDDPTNPTTTIATMAFGGGTVAEYTDTTPLSGYNFYRVRGVNGQSATGWSVWVSISVPVVSGGITQISATIM